MSHTEGMFQSESLVQIFNAERSIIAAVHRLVQLMLLLLQLDTMATGDAVLRFL